MITWLMTYRDRITTAALAGGMLVGFLTVVMR